MLGKLPTDAQPTMWSPLLAEMLNPDHQLVQLTKRLDWAAIETGFAPLYSTEGRPSIPIRVMVSLLMLQRLFDVSDEDVVKQWVQNPYWQFFSGMMTFQWKVPCDPTELVKFRHRIGPSGAEAILAWSLGHHRQAGTVQTTTVVIDTTVQEKNVMTPRDHKLYRRIAERLIALAAAERITLRRSYRRVIRTQVMQLRTSNFPKAKKQAKRAERRLRTIAGSLLRDVSRKLSPEGAERHYELLDLMERILTQGQGGPDHVYSLHEPQTRCIARGKDNAQFEFGTKISLAIDPHSGVIVAAMNHHKNCYDGHTTAEVSEQIEALTGTKPSTIIGDQGYRNPAGNALLLQDGITVVTPKDLRRQTKGTAAWRQCRRLLRLRSRIEAVIGHLKAEFRLSRNFLHGWEGDETNVLLAAAGWNLKKLLRFLWLVTQAWLLQMLHRLRPLATRGGAHLATA